jgi:hypothetical protein
VRPHSQARCATRAPPPQGRSPAPGPLCTVSDAAPVLRWPPPQAGTLQSRDGTAGDSSALFFPALLCSLPPCSLPPCSPPLCPALLSSAPLCSALLCSLLLSSSLLSSALSCSTLFRPALLCPALLCPALFCPAPLSSSPFRPALLCPALLSSSPFLPALFLPALLCSLLLCGDAPLRAARRLRYVTWTAHASRDYNSGRYGTARIDRHLAASRVVSSTAAALNR